MNIYGEYEDYLQKLSKDKLQSIVDEYNILAEIYELERININKKAAVIALNNLNIYISYSYCKLNYILYLYTINSTIYNSFLYIKIFYRLSFL